MTVLRPTPVSTDRFSWLPDMRLLVAEASDLPAFDRVFDDACDEGLTLVSARTGAEVVFATNHEERDSEGDLLFWDLVPIKPSGVDCKVRVFND